jgi:methylthioribose-1-phosphate isomerase
VEALLREARTIEAEDVTRNKAIGAAGAEFLRDGDKVLTYCNTGALATAGHGTALGIVRSAVAQGKKIEVIVCETRPYLQGARLTAWELKEDKIPFTLITDNMAGYLMYRKKIQVVAVGADRVAANGDVANKIGTYTLAVLAWTHHIPFYVAAPTSTLDMTVPTGDQIPIEERDPSEVTSCLGRPTAPKGVAAFNPSFDVTPSRLISALITERGVVRAPYADTLKLFMDNTGDRIS